MECCVIFYCEVISSLKLIVKPLYRNLLYKPNGYIGLILYYLISLFVIY